MVDLLTGKYTLLQLVCPPVTSIPRFMDEREELEAWKRLKSRAIRELAERSPGTRPPMWWIHDSPEPQLVVGKRGNPSYSMQDEYESSYEYLSRLKLFVSPEEEEQARTNPRAKGRLLEPLKSRYKRVR